MKIENVKIVPMVTVEAKVGDGTENNPVRIVTQYWNTDGEMVAEKDPVTQLATGSDSANGLEHISTKELVKELQKREGIGVKRVKPFEDVAMTINGEPKCDVMLVIWNRDWEAEV